MAIVRPATEADIPRILELYRELAISALPVEQGREPFPDDYRRIFTEIKNMPGCELMVAEHEGMAVGTVVLLIVPNLSHTGLPWALAENLVVDSRYRGQGLGKLLMNDIITRAKKAGCYRIGLSSDVRRHEAHKFYRALGFEASAVGFRMYF